MLKEVLTISAHAPRILFLTKKQRTSALCVILTLLLVASATGCSFTELTQQKAEETTLPEKPEKGISETAPAPEQAQKDGFLRDAALRTKFTPDAAQVPDDEIVGFFRAAESALADKQGLEFVTPDVLSPETLFRLFLTWTDEDTLRTCFGVLILLLAVRELWLGFQALRREGWRLTARQNKKDADDEP